MYLGHECPVVEIEEGIALVDCLRRRGHEKCVLEISGDDGCFTGAGVSNEKYIEFSH